MRRLLTNKVHIASSPCAISSKGDPVSLFGSLITGVSALSAQSQAMGMVANNIANVSTIGYKRREASFQSLVTSDARNARYTPGSVLARAIQKIAGQGALQQTNSTTDVAITGGGFFVVQRAPTGIQETLYTRSGSFSEDANGYLRNTAGFYLMGWRIGDNGNLPAGRDDISSLEAVNVSLVGGLTKASTAAAVTINLDAAEPMVAFPVAATMPAAFKRTLKVFDTLGAGQNLDFQFQHHASPTASSATATPTPLARSTLLASLAHVDSGETLVISVGSVSSTFTIGATTTAQDLIDFVNGDTPLRAVAAAELTTAGEIRIIARNFGDAVAVTAGIQTGSQSAAAALGFTTMAAYSASTGASGTGLAPATLLTAIPGISNGDQVTVTVGSSSDTFTVGATTDLQDFIDQINSNLAGLARADLTATGALRIQALDLAHAVSVTDATGTPATLMGFTASAAAAPAPPTIFPDNGLALTPNPFGWWQLSLADLDTGAVLRRGSLNFADDGTLNGALDINGAKTILVDAINWANGSELQDIAIDIAGLTQFSGEYNVTSASQNGAELGLRTGVEIDRNGLLTARFSNGQTSPLFQLPIATFSSPDSLAEQTGNAFIQTSESGSYNLREPGTGGSGLIEGSAVEASNVDIADEFTTMIVTHRAYSAGTKVIRAADEMTQELLRLR
ncbi:MAG: flagellar hook-basal body complex protein [Betaproteobacteria bacterium]|nr:flagellar hook-basal body complex protein [Betaproteobacteria bacterium]